MGRRRCGRRPGAVGAAVAERPRAARWAWQAGGYVWSIRGECQAGGHRRAVRRQPVGRGRDDRAQLERGPHRPGARGAGTGAQGRHGAGAPAATAALGPGPGLVEVAGDRGEDDQRAGRHRAREALLPAGLRLPPLPAAGGRLLRVADRRERLREGQAAQAAVLRQPGGRRAAGAGRALRVLARPLPPRRPPGRVAGDLHHRDHRGRTAAGAGARADAALPAAGELRRLAGPGSGRPRAGPFAAGRATAGAAQPDAGLRGRRQYPQQPPGADRAGHPGDRGALF